MKKKLSVVILNWNGKEMLRNFLPSVLKHSTIEGVEICVADNDSTDDSCAMLAQEFPNVRIIKLDRNYGFAEGYNRALTEVDATYTLLLNSDVEVTEGWLPPLLNYMEQHPEVAACQPKLLSWKQKSNFEYAGACGGFIDKYGYPFCRGRIMATTERDDGQYDEIVPIFWATGAALMIRTEEYRINGGLDNRFFAHMEEIDLCWRLKSRGKKIVCIPKSKVYHVGGATLNKENPRKTYLNFRNNLLMLYKNLSEKELKPILYTRMILDGAAALQFLLKGEWRNAKAVWKAHRDFKDMRPMYIAIRKENLKKTCVTNISERTNWSILFRYYILGKKRFCQLVN